MRNANQPVSWTEDPPSADEAVAKLRLQLRHFALEDLIEDGYVRWNRDEGAVVKGPRFDEQSFSAED